MAIPLHLSILLTTLASALASSPPSPSTCTFIPFANATSTNYPGSPSVPSSIYPYDISSLSSVPLATICTSTSGNRSAELACARTYIDAIDEQLAFLYARRLGYAAVAGASKFATGTDLNDPTRNGVVAQGMASKVLKYGGTEAAGSVMGGEGCMIYAALEYEVEIIQGDCDAGFELDIERVCDQV